MRRALGIVLAGTVLLVLFSAWTVVPDDRHAAFEARGTRVPGVVAEVHHGIRGLLTADVRYHVAGVEREGLIQLGYTYADVKPGDQVTVIYDPSDPDEIAAPGIANAPDWVVNVSVLLLLGGLSTFIVGVVHLLRG